MISIAERYTISIAKLYEGACERGMSHDQAKALIRARLLMEMGIALGIAPESEEGSDLLLDVYELASAAFPENNQAEGVVLAAREIWNARVLEGDARGE